MGCNKQKETSQLWLTDTYYIQIQTKNILNTKYLSNLYIFWPKPVKKNLTTRNYINHYANNNQPPES